MRSLLFLALLIAIVVPFFFFELGDMALTDPDESFYAETAKEMFKAGEWVTPMIFGKAQFEKPPFYYWLVIISYNIFGVNEFSARFPSALFGVLGIIGIYFLGRLLFSPICGFLSALILATCVEYVVLARACVTDIVLTVFILYSFLFFILGWTSQKRFYYILASIMAALSVLTKGPIGIFVLLVTIFFYILFTRTWRHLKRIPIVWCIFIFLAVSLPWYVVVLKLHGSLFMDEFFGFHNITRFLEPEHEIGSSPFFYIPVIIAGFAPWSFFLPLGIWDMYKEQRAKSIEDRGQRTEDRAQSTEHRGKGGEMFLLLWFGMVFVFFSIARTKLVTYIFPLFPPLAIVVGRFWERFIFLDKEQDKKLSKYMNISYFIFVIFSLLAMVGIYLFIRFVKYRYAHSLPSILMIESIFASGLLLSLLLLMRNKRLMSFLAIVVTIILLSFPVIKYLLPSIEISESSKVLSFKVKELSSAFDLIAGESDHRRGIAFYTDRSDIINAYPTSELLRVVLRKEKIWFIVRRKHYEQLKEMDGYKPGTVSEIFAHAGKYVLITNKPDDM